jgi:hypothetical protein
MPNSFKELVSSNFFPQNEKGINGKEISESGSIHSCTGTEHGGRLSEVPEQEVQSDGDCFIKN